MNKTFLLLVLLLLTPLTAQSVEFSWENEAGKEVALSSLKGKPVVLHFWASWCGPCKSEMPALVSWVEKHPEATVVIVALERERDGAISFLKRQGIQLSLNMGSMSKASGLGIRGLPSTFVIGANGEVKHRYVGEVDWADEKMSDEMLAWL